MSSLSVNALQEGNGFFLRKRARCSEMYIAASREELLAFENEIGDKLTLAFALSTHELIELVQSRRYAGSLRVLRLCPQFDDTEITHVLNLDDPRLYFPVLEELSVSDHAVSSIRFNSSNFPELRSLKISHPLGVTINLFQVACPDTLESIEVQYATVRDGYGLTMSMSQQVNPKLHTARKFATTVFLSGVV
jgi:hypothetical protein